MSLWAHAWSISLCAHAQQLLQSDTLIGDLQYACTCTANCISPTAYLYRTICYDTAIVEVCLNINNRTKYNSNTFRPQVFGIQLDLVIARSTAGRINCFFGKNAGLFIVLLVSIFEIVILYLHTSSRVW